MFPYWILYIFPAINSFFHDKFSNQLQKINLIGYAIFSILMIGLRFEVGGDWESYLNYNVIVSGEKITDILFLRDPGYMALNWISVKIGSGIVGVNIVCGILFVTGLVKFSNNQPLPWLAISIAVPYLLIVVVMGYSRQGVALGFILWAFSLFQKEHVIKFFSLIIIASLFHKSALIMLPFILLLMENKITGLIIIVPFSILAVYFLWFDTFDQQWSNYIDKQMESSGGFIRVLMNVIPSILVYAFYHKFKFFPDFKLIKIISVLSMVLFFFERNMSTAVDRVSLYMTPIQLIVFSRLPVFFDSISIRTFIMIVILLYYALVLFVWLHFADHRAYWIPYQWHLF